MKKFKIFLILAVVLTMGGINLFIPQTQAVFYAIIEGAYYQDSNGDGQVDRIKLVFNKYIATCTFSAADWSFNDRGSISLSDPTKILNGAGDLAPCDGSTTYFYLSSFGTAYATGGTAPPKLNYVNNSNIVIPGGGPVNDFIKFVIDDDAAPIPRSARYRDNDSNGQVDRIIVTMTADYWISFSYVGSDWTVSPGSVGLANETGVSVPAVGSTDLTVWTTGSSGATGGSSLPSLTYSSPMNRLIDAAGNQVLPFSLMVSDGASPVIMSTVPSSGATGVSRTLSSVRITFSEPMTTGTVTASLSAGTWGPPSWSADSKTLTRSRLLTLSYDTNVTVSVTGEDQGGYLLTSGASPAVVLPWNFQIESDPSSLVSAAQSTVSASPTSLAADGSSTSTITVTAKNAAGSPLSGKLVGLTSSRGATDTIVTMVGTTGADGKAYFQVRSNTAGAATFSASAAGVPITQTATVTFTSVTPDTTVSASQSTVSASPTSVAADGSSFSVITVTVRNAAGNPLSGKTVSLSSSRGATDSITTPSSITGAEGRVYFDVRSNTAGSATFTATAAGVPITQTATVTFTATTPTLGPVSASRSSVYASPASVTANNISYSTVYVTVRDASDNLLSGKTVTLSSSRGSTDTITIVSGTTNSSGQATFQVKSGTVGTATLTAVADGTTITQTVTVTFTSSGLSLIYGDLFKESGSTAVYYYADNGKRYVFPTSSVYFSWYSDFSTIKTVSHGVVTSVPFGGNVFVKPGTYLVQFVSMDTPFRVLDSKVYVLTAAGQLRWITSASVAASFYGADWERKIIAVPEVYKTNYGGAVAGADVTSTSDYSKASVEATARTISDLY